MLGNFISDQNLPDPRRIIDIEAAEKFIYALAPSGHVTFQTVDDVKKRNAPKLRCVKSGTLAQLEKLLRWLSSQGAAIYVTINETDLTNERKTENIRAVRAFFTDHDRGMTREALDALLAQIELKPHIIVQSSPGKWHVYWLVEDAPLDMFTSIQRRLGALMRMEHPDEVSDLPRVMRLPGWPHQKDPDNPQRVEIEYLDEDPIPYKYADFLRTLEKAEHQNDVQVATPTPVAPAKIPIDAGVALTANGRSELTKAATNLSTGARPYSEAEEARLRSALKFVPAKQRPMWLKVGMAIHELGWKDKGYVIWCVWSQTVLEKYDEKDQQKTWESFDRPYDGRRITVATIFRTAKKNGWTDPTRAERDYLTDLGNARHLVKRHGENLRYIHEWNKWIVWTGNYWRRDEDGEIMRFAKETVEDMFSKAVKIADGTKRTALVKHAVKCQGVARLEAMIKLAETEPEVVLSATKLDANPWLLGVQNGVVDLQSNAFREGRRDDLITLRAGVAFNSKMTCPNWEQFLHRITGGDENLIRYMQRAIGYTLTGSVREEVLFVQFGTGNNGKSTFRETLHKMLGEYAIAADAGLLIERKNPGAATPEIARLQGRRLVAINETAENDKLNEARVKFLTSQDTITGRKLYADFFDFIPTHKTFLTTNHKPIVRNADIGTWRRIHLWPFTVTIPQEVVEKDFATKRLVPELSGILNWALKGLAAYRGEGLNPPATVRAATKDYREEMDVIGQWLDERCDLDPQATVPSGLAYSDYNTWAAAEIGWSFPALKFRRQLSDRGFGARKSHGQRQIVGLRLKSLLASMTVVPTRSGPP